MANSAIGPTPNFSGNSSSEAGDMKFHLQNLLDSKERQLQLAGTLGTRVLAQQMELEERVRQLQLQETDAGKDEDDELDAEATERYRELVETIRTWDAENAQLSSGFGYKPSTDPSQSTALVDLPRGEPRSRAIGSSVAQSRRAKNAAHRADDVEFAFEIGSGLLTEVRRLQSLLVEREKAIQDMKEEKDDLEKSVEGLRTALRQQEQSADKYKEENWNLEVTQQELRVQFSDSQSAAQRLEAEHKRLNRLLNSSREAADSHKNESDNLKNDLDGLKAKHETDIAQARKQAASLRRDKSDLQSTIDRIRGEYKAENWNLEVTIQELRVQLGDLQSASREAADSHKNQFRQLKNELDGLKAKHKKDLAQAGKNAASLQHDKSDLQSTIDRMKAEVARAGGCLPPGGRNTNYLTPVDRDDDDVDGLPQSVTTRSVRGGPRTSRNGAASLGQPEALASEMTFVEADNRKSQTAGFGCQADLVELVAPEPPYPPPRIHLTPAMSDMAVHVDPVPELKPEPIPEPVVIMVEKSSQTDDEPNPVLVSVSGGTHSRKTPPAIDKPGPSMPVPPQLSPPNSMYPSVLIPGRKDIPPGRPSSPPPANLIRRATTPLTSVLSVHSRRPSYNGRQYGASMPSSQQGTRRLPSRNTFRSAADAAAYAQQALPQFDRSRASPQSSASSDHGISSTSHPPAYADAPLSPCRDLAADRSGMNGGGTSTDSTIIHAITQTMIGEFLYKYTRRTIGKGHGDKRHRRFFWVHPYTKTLYWSPADPGSVNVSESSAKSSYIEGVRSVLDPNPMPPGLCQYSVILSTAQREMKITALTKERHDIWLNALKYLLSHPSVLPVTSPGNGTAMDRPPVTPGSQSPYNARSPNRPWSTTPRGQRSRLQMSVVGSHGKRSGTPAVEYLRRTRKSTQSYEAF